MGLALEVGILADLKIHDVEGYTAYKQQFDMLNEVLRRFGLPEHQEPENFISVWGCSMGGYSSLHYLRRIAAYLWAGYDIPEPGNRDAADDPLLLRYYDWINRTSSQIHFDSNPIPEYLDDILRYFQRDLPDFPHLVNHSDAQGFYLPIHFDTVLSFPKSGIVGTMVGSCYKLQEECRILAAELELPLNVGLHDPIVQAATSTPQGEGDHKWQRYGIESYACLALYHACKKSIQTGAALVFC